MRAWVRWVTVYTAAIDPLTSIPTMPERPEPLQPGIELRLAGLYPTGASVSARPAISGRMASKWRAEPNWHLLSGCIYSRERLCDLGLHARVSGVSDVDARISCVWISTVRTMMSTPECGVLAELDRHGTAA